MVGKVSSLGVEPCLSLFEQFRCAVKELEAVLNDCNTLGVFCSHFAMLILDTRTKIG